MNQRIVASPIGSLLLGTQGGALVQVRLFEPGEEITVFCIEDPILDETQKQLTQYFAGERTQFDLPILMRGTAFEQAVWLQLLEIPFGRATSYGALAEKLGKVSASRAVGRACSRNPLLIVVPCHRVVAASGWLTGFAAGMAAKRTLLMLEGHRIERDRMTV